MLTLIALLALATSPPTVYSGVEVVATGSYYDPALTASGLPTLHAYNRDFILSFKYLHEEQVIVTSRYSRVVVTGELDCKDPGGPLTIYVKTIRKAE